MKAQSTASFLFLVTSSFASSVLGNCVQSPQFYPNLAKCISEQSFFSCENTTTIENTCCSPTPGGLVLSTQFWSTYTGLENKGQKLPKDSWTLHGLWPDNCDGSFEQYCDFSRQFDPAPDPAVLPNGVPIPVYKGPGVDVFIKQFGKNKLLDYMNTYWIAQGTPNADFWAHEFSKHATCTSTFDVACYGEDYQKHVEVIDFFETAIRFFQNFPTFKLLAAANIVPSNKTMYKLDDLEAAVISQLGAVPYFGCTHNGTVLSEVWYFTHVFGTEQFGSIKTIESVTPSSCNRSGEIWYYERTADSERDVEF
ncbi:hypothetical protein AGABI1DRAFT_51918 [Agaricus bisporus var. burnettii JB137-S8]|uniref:ribonuclease T2 n=2 Tax=Agaricus bisporus var. burnettii TaxID=192524 RepID=K5XL79_AGABU|nr:uncharacterized protein AGABI1DRAFT_51918 [Agaricus bisporus var. burnettii JB137-S8]EKM84152.1 hypothetical protein AGABI1DRAFT_51918 [Agaricus bisporus var. burnettii JB137-S8]KAF7784056.1 hypothetical protein Agabi119p4_221 [Agaricus bisporus var. burnettii]